MGMAVSIVVGGQYGSEGKGKVVQWLAKSRSAAAVVRVGGSNSGHTAIAPDGSSIVLRQLPTGAVLPGVLCVIAPGSYIDPPLLHAEIDRVGLGLDRLLIDPNAFVITEADRAEEEASGMRAAIGSTNSGTGAAVRRRTLRQADTSRAGTCESLKPFVGETVSRLRQISRRERVVIEGTQGFGLSVLHSPFYPYTTTRDTSAAGALAEAGLSPTDVDEVVLTLRAFPIRVGGNSGPLANETTWEELTRISGAAQPLQEFTSVTGSLRRVAHFDPVIVRRAIEVNNPTMVVMNHVDYIDATCVGREGLTQKASSFVRTTAEAIGRPIDFVGVSPDPVLLPSSPAIEAVAS